MNAKFVPLLALGCAVVGGAVGGWLVPLLRPEPSEPRKVLAPPVDSAAASEQVSDLDARLTELEDRVSALSGQLRVRQTLEKQARAIAQAETSSKTSGVAPAALPAGAEDPAFQLAVRSVLDEVEWEKDQQQEAEREQRQSARVERQAARLKEQLKLNPEQAAEVSTILTEQAEQLRALRVQRRERAEPPTRQERQQQFAELRRQTEERLRQTLTPEQFASYEKMAEEDGFGFDFGGRRRGQVSAENPAR
jgi:hypothetical protein